MAINANMQSGADRNDSSQPGILSCDLFETIISLNTGEALIYCPSAPIKGSMDKDFSANVLGNTYVRVKIRARLSEDGGKSVMAR